MLKVWLLQIGETLPLKPGVRKMRTAMLAEQLAARGHEVLWWASAFDHASKSKLASGDMEFEIGPRQTVRALRALGYRRNVSIRRYLDHRFLAARFRTQARQMERPDVIVAAIPDYHLALEAVRYARDAGVPVIIDVRDMWPDQFLDFLPGKLLRRMARLVLEADSRKVRWLMASADSLVGTSRLYLDWALRQAGREVRAGDMLLHLGAQRMPDPSVVVVNEEFQGVLARLERKFVISFIGTFGRYYNPAIVARAARLLHEADRNDDRIRFVIAGDGAAFNEVAREARGVPTVELTGWLGNSEICGLLAHTTIGIIPAGEDADATPNKAFTYLSASLPILSSLSGEVRQMIEQEGVGFQFAPGDEWDLARVVRELAEKPQQVRRAGENAGRLFSARFDAERIYQHFADHVERTVKNRCTDDAASPLVSRLAEATGPTCPCCGEQGSAAHGSRSAFWHAVGCSRCNHVFSLSVTGSTVEDNRIFEQPEYLRWRAEFKNSVTRTAAQQAKLISEQIGTIPGRVLEIGCSTGEMLAQLATMGWECHGIDASEKAIQIARQDYKNISVTVGKELTLPVPTLRFDLIMAFHALEHVGDVDRLLAECCRLLTPGGHLVFFVPNWCSWSRIVLGDYWPDFMPEHIHYFSERSFRALLNRHSLEIAHAETGSSSWAWLAGMLRLLRGREWARLRLQPTSRQMPGKAKMRILCFADILLTPLFFLETWFGGGNELRIFARRRI